MAASDQSWRREEFGPYTLFECLGIGGMATVHRAVHRHSKEEFAIKRLLPQLASDQLLIKQFVREAEMLQAIAHPSIVTLVEHGQVDGVHYLAMERIEGQSLLALLQRASKDRQPGPIGVSIWIVHQMLTALEHAMHAIDGEGLPLHIVHRDLSPSNVIITRAGHVKIIDFGVAKGLEGRYATYSGRIKGKLGYMSPEVLTGRELDGRSDLYSVAVLAWELLTAQRLFGGSESEQLALRARHRERTPPSRYNRLVPKELDALLAKALAEKPEERWASHGDMLAALAPFMASAGRGASTEALLRWLELVESEDEKTTQFSDVKRFAVDVATVVDPVFDAGQRHRNEETVDSDDADPITELNDEQRDEGDTITIDTAELDS